MAFWRKKRKKADPLPAPVPVSEFSIDWNVEPAPAPQRFIEAAGATIDPDEDEGWRKLSGDTRRDLSPLKQDRQREIADYLWQSNLIANRLIELPIAFLLAKGVRLVVEDEAAQQILDRHWKDGLNQWDIKLVKRVRELSMFGEQCWIAFRDDRSGFIRWGYLDPADIATVVTDPENREQAIGIVTKKDKKGRARRYRVACNVPETAFHERTQEIRKTFTDGDCLWFTINDLSSGKRGRGDLLPQCDWLDSYDAYLFGELDRADFLKSFLWDVTRTGATQQECEAYAQSLGSPKPASVRVHNENETWTAVTPNLQAADSAEGARLFRNHILGGATVPEHWYGGGGDVNRSTGESMTGPTEKNLEMRQQYIGYMLVCMGTYVLRSAWDRLDAELQPEEEEILDTLKAEWPEMSAKDVSRYAAAMQQVVVAAIAAITEGILTRATAIRLVQAIAAEIGVEFDAEAELEAAMAEQLEQAEEDTFTPVPEALDEPTDAVEEV